jgi:tripartite-type tricarboxylate transporter receptor subunit TctC
MKAIEVSIVRRIHLSRRDLVLASMLAPVAAYSQSQVLPPRQAIQIIVPQAAGGAVDIIARALAEYCAQARGVPAIVINKPGAAGEIAASFVAGAAADGGTLLVGNSSTMVVSPQARKTKYDPLRDFRPLGGIVVADTIMVANKTLGVRTLDELVQYAKANPGRVAYGSNGVGGAFHLAMEYFQYLTGTTMLHVPFNGAAQAEMALVSNQVAVMVANTGPSMGHIRSGALVPLAVTGSQRSLELPDLVLASHVVPNYVANTWVGVYAPAALPDAQATELNSMLEQFFQTPKSAAFLKSRGFIPVPANLAKASSWMRDEMKTWGGIVAEARKKGPIE